MIHGPVSNSESMSCVSSKGVAEVVSSIRRGGALQGNFFTDISMGEGMVSSSCDVSMYQLPLSLYLATPPRLQVTSVPLAEDVRVRGDKYIRLPLAMTGSSKKQAPAGRTWTDTRRQ